MTRAKYALLSVAAFLALSCQRDAVAPERPAMVGRKSLLASDIANNATRIFFASGREGGGIYVLNAADGSNVRRIKAGTLVARPFSSRDGRQLVFDERRDGQTDIYMIDTDGRNEHRITTGVQGADIAPALSPDGTQVVFERFRDGQYDIYVINVDGTNARQLTT